MENSAIEWCHHTFNPWRGCTKVSDGCKNCYAETMSRRNTKTLGMWGPSGTRVVASESQWRLPLKWDKAAKAAGERHRVFCASLADVLEDWQGPMLNAKGEVLHRDEGKLDGNRPIGMFDMRRQLFETINATPHLDWLLLTKRPENARRMLPDRWLDIRWPHNVWMGTSVENQSASDERIPHLLQIPAKVRFLSMEPLLGPVTVAAIGGINWVIVGGESGQHARPMSLEWASSIREHCRAASVPFFFKQLGGRGDKGGKLENIPENLRVREFPKDIQSAN